METKNIIKQTLATFGENCSQEFYIKEGIKRGQKELLEELWHTTSDFGQEQRYELIYRKILKKINEK